MLIYFIEKESYLLLFLKQYKHASYIPDEASSLVWGWECDQI
jgi:hypothetical protein